MMRRLDPRLTAIPLDQLDEHSANPNVMPVDLYAKLRGHIERSGRYPPLIVRRLPSGRYQIIDGGHRARILRELGFTVAWCLVWDVDDLEALVLVATLNRLVGADIPGRRAELLQELSAQTSLAELARLLPEDERAIEDALETIDFDLDAALAAFDEEVDRSLAERPVLFSFGVDPADAPMVEQALTTASASLSGANRRGQALVALARAFLAAGR